MKYEISAARIENPARETAGSIGIIELPYEEDNIFIGDICEALEGVADCTYYWEEVLEEKSIINLLRDYFLSKTRSADAKNRRKELHEMGNCKGSYELQTALEDFEPCDCWVALLNKDIEVKEMCDFCKKRHLETLIIKKQAVWQRAIMRKIKTKVCDDQ